MALFLTDEMKPYMNLPCSFSFSFFFGQSLTCPKTNTLVFPLFITSSLLNHYFYHYSSLLPSLNHSFLWLQYSNLHLYRKPTGVPLTYMPCMILGIFVHLHFFFAFPTESKFPWLYLLSSLIPVLNMTSLRFQTIFYLYHHVYYSDHPIACISQVTH